MGGVGVVPIRFPVAPQDGAEADAVELLGVRGRAGRGGLEGQDGVADRGRRTGMRHFGADAAREEHPDPPGRGERHEPIHQGGARGPGPVERVGVDRDERDGGIGQAARLRNSVSPSVPPASGSIRFSGCGIRPSTLRAAE